MIVYRIVITMGIKRFRRIFDEVVCKFRTSLTPSLSSTGKKINMINVGWRFCLVDAFQKIYQEIYFCMRHHSEYTDKTGRNINHLYYIIYYVYLCMINKIIPIFVFDGVSPKLKKKLMKRRKQHQSKVTEKFGYVNDETNRWLIDVKECKKLLDALGLPYIQAPCEADSLCAKLIRTFPDKIYGIISDDTDCLVFGGSVLLSGFTKKTCLIDMYSLTNLYDYIDTLIKKICDEKKIALYHKITHEEFIIICIILGTEYCGGIDIKKFDLILEELVLNNFDLNKVNNVPYRIKKKWKEIFNYYNITYEIDMELPEFVFNKPDQKSILSIINMPEELCVKKNYFYRIILEIIHGYDTYIEFISD